MALKYAPYEFMVRWENGVLSGSHIRLLERYIDDATGAIIRVREGDALPPARAAELGFPLADVLSQLQIDAIDLASTLEAENSALKAQLAAVQPTPSEAQLLIDLAAKDANIQALLAELATLKGTP